MRNRFTITISDINGSKHYLLHQVIKKIIIYFVLLVVLLIVGGSLFISILMKEVSSLEQRKEIAKKEYIVLKENFGKEYKELQDSNALLKEKIDVKTKEYSEIQEKVNNIEELIGLKPDITVELSDRLDKINFTSKQQQIFFDNIPSGAVLPQTIINTKFGWRIHPILKKREFHKGVDLKAKMRTPVRAPADGVVEFAGFHKRSGFGNLVIIDHNYGFKTYYGHLYKKMVVKMGQVVKKGDIIAYTGSSGLSTGPHLHYEVRFVSRALNPIYFLRWNKLNFKNIFKKEKRVPWESLVKIINYRFQIQKQQSSLPEPK
ncbi:MAG: peptidoglycan DD-metalloendopeptidase family protein [Epsilonproteobacteria bacterium]|nr:peptidoglycan DD-metalloendopeptidase family protein [Campylobacterota bacterium]